MKLREDGSVQSSSTPTWQNAGRSEDYSIYRGMVTKVVYVDDPSNPTSNSQNPRVLYDVVVLGGFASGQIISNCRLASDLGGNTSFWERTLKASSKDVSKTRLSECDGDIVFVQFIQGHTGFPVITSLDLGIKTLTDIGAKLSEGPRSKRQFNGVQETINKDGELEIQVKGGKPDSERGGFTPNSTPLVTFKTEKSEKHSRTFKSGLKIEEDGKNDSVKISTQGKAKLSLDKGKVALGANSIEVLSKIVDSLSELITLFGTVASHSHIGNLGYNVSPPDTMSDWNTAKSNLESIKSDLESIKGSL